MEDNNEAKKSNVEVDNECLGGLIDVASEDDSLLFSSFLDPTSYEFSEADEDEKCFKEGKDESLLKDREFCGDEEKEEVLRPRESPEPQKVTTTKSGKYNLRKSLAWDNAFFTSAGVLEPEEISSMMGSNGKSGKKGLPTIEEDVNRSNESISTFQSECIVENGEEFVLFEDVRASIQRSATPGKSKEMGATEVATSPTSSIVDMPSSQKKMKPKVSPKKLSIRAQGLGTTTKQPVGVRGLSTSISKPPNGLSRVMSLPTSSMNRSSLDISKTKPKLPAGKQPLVTRISARPALPKPVAVKSAIRSSSTSKNELTSSCSSLESCASASSSASHKSSLNSIKKKIDPRSRLASQPLVNRPAPRSSMGQPRIPPQPINKTSKSSKLSSTGSTSDCSSESSRASATSKIAKGNGLPIVKPLKNSNVVRVDAKEDTKRVSAVSNGLVPQNSAKPSGLRVPTPKIGFFDGVRNGSGSSASKKTGKSPNSRTKASSRVVSVSSQNKLYSKVNAEDQLQG